MFKTSPGPDRNLLGFKDEVLTAFNFLVKDYGFKLVKSEVTYVRYESQQVFVNVYHGRSSYQVEFEIGLLSNRSSEYQPTFTLREIIELMDAQKETGYTFFQASTKERVQKYVSELAELVRKYAKSALIGDHSTFEKLAQIQSQKSDKLMLEMKLSRVREKAEKAWNEKNYDKLIELYEPVKENLTSTELKKLEYAKKKI